MKCAHSTLTLYTHTHMKLGITGISGSGKHTAATFFKQRKWIILDADKMAHDLYRPYTYVWKDIVERFGEGILTTKDLIDRQKLGAIVFDSKNSEALEDLNKIVHPAIRREIENALYHYRNRDDHLIIVAALWESIGLNELCDKILLIKSNSSLAMERSIARDGITEDVYKARIKNQTEPPDPDFIVENNGEFKEFYKQLSELNIE